MPGHLEHKSGTLRLGLTSPFNLVPFSSVPTSHPEDSGGERITLKELHAGTEHFTLNEEEGAPYVSSLLQTQTSK